MIITMFVVALVIYYYCNKRDYRKAKKEYFGEIYCKYTDEDFNRRKLETAKELSKYREFTTEEYLERE